MKANKENIEYVLKSMYEMSDDLLESMYEMSEDNNYILVATQAKELIREAGLMYEDYLKSKVLILDSQY